MSSREEPKYTIKAAAKVAGLGAATLRAWEKRYGIPAPARTPTRYRLYSDANIREIQWVKERVNQGVAPRQAARLAIERRTAGLAFDDRPSLEPSALISGLKTACLAYDEEAAQDVVRFAAAILTPHEIFRTVVLPTVAQIGRDWETGLVNVSQEHFTSMMTRRFALRLLDLSPTGSAIPPIVCACAPDELHELGLLAVAVEVRLRGYRAVYLGQATPVDAALAAVERLDSRVAFVAVTLREHLDPWIAARDSVAEISSRTGAQVVWGGPGAAAAALHGLPGSVALTIEDAVAAIVTQVGRTR